LTAKIAEKWNFAKESRESQNMMSFFISFINMYSYQEYLQTGSNE